jgi:hypothetical protein
MAPGPRQPASFCQLSKKAPKGRKVRAVNPLVAITVSKGRPDLERERNPQ